MYAEIDTHIVRWIARIGAAGAEEVADQFEISAASARSRLSRGVRAGSLRATRPLREEPTLYAATRSGLRSVGLEALGPCRISRSGFVHLAVSARIAVAIARANAEAIVVGERELRLLERRAGKAVASAVSGVGRDGQPALHRPDLVVFGPRALIAIEVELTVKSPRRLREIVRDWSRCRYVPSVVYYAAPDAARAVRRAVEALSAGDVITVLEIDPAQRRPLTESDLAALTMSEAIAVAA